MKITYTQVGDYYLPDLALLEVLIKQMAGQQGITEQLKSERQMEWVGKMNNIEACAEEIVLKEIIYS